MKLTDEQLRALDERSKDDHASKMIVGSEVRMLVREVQRHRATDKETARTSDNELMEILHRYGGDLGYVIRRMHVAERVIEAAKGVCKHEGHRQAKEPLAQALISLDDSDFTKWHWTGSSL